MDVVGHILLGAAVAGQCTPYTVMLSLAPDIAALPLQNKRVRDNIEAYPYRLAFYKIVHSPLTLLFAYWLPEPGFLVVATHIVSDMFTHKKPYSDFGVRQWDFDRPWYWVLVAALGASALIRCFFFPAG